MSDEGIRVVGAPPVEPPPAGPVSGPSGPPPARRRMVPALATVAVAGVIGTVAFGLAWGHAQGQLSAANDAQAAAKRFLVLLTNFDAKSIDGDFNQINAMATGQFAQQAKQVFNSRIRAQLQAAQASTRGQVRYIYTQSYRGGQATFYALVDQTYANTKTKGPQVDELRLVVDMAKVSGQWKVANLTDLGASSVPVVPSNGATGGSGSGG